MYRITFVVVLALLSFSLCIAQDTNNSENETEVVIAAGTELVGETMQSTGADKASPGDDFKLVLVDDVKGEKGTIPKGSELFGRVASTAKLSDKNTESSITFFFDFIKHGEEFITFAAQIISIENTPPETKFAVSERMPGGTVVSLPGKNLVIEKGATVRIKLLRQVNSSEDADF